MQFQLGFTLLLVWIVWWLFAVNWQRAWPFLRQGSWVPLTLLAVFAAFVWSRIVPGPLNWPGFELLPGIWGHLLGVGLLVGAALACGWVQILLEWSPAEIDLEPPAHADAHHGHGSEHGHGGGHH